MVAVALSALAACSSAEEASKPSSEELRREFSTEDKDAAQALSIGRQTALTKTNSPYERALLCKIGIDVLAERLQDANGLGGQQREALRLARDLFETRLSAAAAGEGKSESQIEQDAARAMQDHPNESELARVAIACLQRAQNEAQAGQ